MLERFDQFTFAISSIHRFVQKIQRDEMERYGLKGAAVQYLLALMRHPEGLTAAQLSQLCDRDKAAVSRIVAEMEGKGLLHRSGPGYRAVLTLTEAGIQAAGYTDQRACLAAELVGRGVSEEDRLQFYQILAKYAANIQTLSEKGIPREE